MISRIYRGLAHRLTGNREYILQLETALAAARQTIEEMALVKQRPDADGFFEASGVRLYRSAFNTAWLDELGIAPKTIIDVGSLDAGDAVRFKHTYPHARVITFEADPIRASVVKANAATFGVEAVEAAAFSRDGEIDWYQATANGVVRGQGSAFRQNEALNRKFPHIRQAAAPIRVRATRLDSFCREAGVSHIDLLHMDVQGAEHDVLVGLGNLRPSLVYLELDDGVAGWVGAKGRAAVHALMAELGYAVGADCVTDRLYVPRSLIRR